MSYKDDSWASRYTKLGDQAEEAFRAWADENKVGYIRYGLDRPPLNVASLPKRIRYSPDFLTNNYFVECIGCGRDQVAKLAIYKWDCLEWWATVHPVNLFVYDSYKKRSKLISLEHVNDMIDDLKVELGSFKESKAYWGMPADALFS